MKKVFKQNSEEQFTGKINQICNLLNYNFSSNKWITEALTRQSAITERHPDASTKNYQRLEFLGDSVLNLVIADMIYELFPDKKEEDLHPLRSFIVSNDTLATYATKLNLGRFLIIGKGEEHQNIRNNKNILADVTEALIGAVFNDTGRNYDITKNVVLNFLKPVIFNDRNYLEYRRELNYYYENKMRPLEREALPGYSNIINISNENIMTDSEYDYSNKRSFITDTVNQNTLLTTNYKTYPSMEFISIQELFASFNDTKMKNLSADIESKLTKFTQNINDYIFLEFDLVLINSNDNFLPILRKNISLTEILVSGIKNKIKESYENLKIKEHFFFSKLLLHFIVNMGNGEISDLFNTSIFCLLHNGISDFYRNHFDSGKNLFEKVLDSINMLENDSEIIKDPHLIAENKCLCINYISDIAFINKDVSTLNDCVKIISSIPNKDNSFRVAQLQKVFVKNYILNRNFNNELNQVNEVIDKFFNQMNKLSEPLKNSKLYLEQMLDMKIIKYKLNQGMKEMTEFAEYEANIQQKCGKDSFLFVNICKLYMEKLSEEYEKTKNFSTLEKMTKLIQRIVKILLVNFNVNDQILTENLLIYKKLVEDYIIYN